MPVERLSLDELCQDQGGDRGAARRLRVALSSNAADMDVVGLVRHVLRQRELADEHQYQVALPAGRGWPGPDVWALAGLPARLVNGSVLVGPSSPWNPSWDLMGRPAYVDLAVSSPYGMAVNGQRLNSLSREFASEPLDPFLLGIDDLDAYRGTAQREAVRAAIRCPAGGVLHVLLPTGTGKSLVGLARGLTDRHGTTVVIVPTIALALDQEKKARTSALADVRRLPKHLAYYGGLPEEAKREILDQVRTGSQGVLFVSPEAAVQGRLSQALHELAANGGLSALVVDEAHLVATWGGSFRPAFQLLPALRAGLLAAGRRHGHPGFATITMTGTLPPHALDVLLTSFPADETAVVGAAWVRSEPRYLASHFGSVSDRDDALLETLPFMPRPMIVYVSRPDRARALTKKIGTAGYRRVAAFHGETPDEERRRVLEGWGGQGTEPTVDIVVATSAFGLGIDVPDVRTVIHACLPETFDRFYQEVGRGGRDWHASVSLLMTAPQDIDESASLRKDLVIGQEKGWRRWKRLIERQEFVEGDWWRVPIDRRPDGAPGTDFDIRWNLHLVNLMRHAGILRLRTAPTVVQNGMDEEDPEGAIRPKRVALLAQTVGVPPANAEEWSLATDSHRRAVYSAVEAGGRLVGELLRQQRHTDEIARDAYRIDRHDPRILIEPVGSCQGCAHCEKALTDSISTSGSHVAVSQAFPVDGGPWFAKGPTCVLTVIDDDDERVRFVNRAVEAGVPRVAGRLAIPHPRFWERALRRSRLGWVVHDVKVNELSPLPSVVLVEDDVPPELLWAPGLGARVIVLRSTSARPGDRRPLHELHGTVDPSNFGGT